VSQK